jgi:hypothetical protein
LCNVDGVPGVLLELRGGKLRSHAGEVRYVCPQNMEYIEVHDTE